MWIALLLMEQLMNSYMAIMAERNAAIRERNMAIVEKRKALADRDMAMLQRDEAVADRNRAIIERDDAISQIQCMESSTEINTAAHIASEKGVSQGSKMHQRQHVPHLPHYAEAAYCPRKVPFSDVILDSDIASEPVKSKKVKQTIKATNVPSKLSTKASKKIKKGTKVLSKQVTVAALSGFRNESDMVREGENLDKPVEWKDDLCLNQISFDEATIPVPVCSCTGVLQPCYRWGNGGWQSACCTTTLSMYPLPQLPNKRHSRIGGRKMSGGAFSKLLSRLAGEGHDISTPIDLKYHWAKHGTNRYSTIK